VYRIEIVPIITPKAYKRYWESRFASNSALILYIISIYPREVY